MRLTILSPATNTPIQSLEMDSDDQIDAKIEACRLAQTGWAAESMERRIEVIKTFRHMLEQEVDACALIQCQETGKPLTQAKGEIKASLERIDYFISRTESVLATETVLDTPDWQENISYEPLGVCVNISAWNYPFFVGLNVLIPALLAGNGVCYKPSEFATLTGLKIARLFHDSGVPKTLLATIVGAGPQGARLCQGNIDGVFFTGSESTGKNICQTVRDKLIPIGLELGGKDPTYITEDTDIDAAVAAAGDGAFYNAGQSCCAVERIYVHDSIYQPFVENFTQWASHLKVGDPEDSETYIGPLTRKEHIGYLQQQVEDALHQGAKMVVAGGARDPGSNFFHPVVLTDVHHKMKVMVEESFGPIIGIQSVADDQEAIRLMNDTRYGLTAGVYCRDRQRAVGILGQLEAGSVYWNACDRVSCRLPWTGWKNSGLGSTLSHIGIRAFTKPKAWHLRSS